MFYYLDQQQNPIGPHSREELLDLLQRGTLRPDTLVAEDGGAEWLPLQQLCTQNLRTTPCPYCGGELQPQMTDGTVQLPLLCPHCRRQLRPEVQNSTYYHTLFALQHPFSFKGRAMRREFWGMVLLAMFLVPAIHMAAVGVSFFYVDGEVPVHAANVIMAGLFVVWCVMLWVFAALSVRRLRDAALPTGLAWGLAGFPLSMLMTLAAFWGWERHPLENFMQEAAFLFLMAGMLSTFVIFVCAFFPTRNR